VVVESQCQDAAASECDFAAVTVALAIGWTERRMRIACFLDRPMLAHLKRDHLVRERKIAKRKVNDLPVLAL
jgi:hypothetical protein